MHDVRRPEEAALVTDPVEPVITEFVAEEEQAPGPPLKAYVKNGEAIQVGKNGKLKDLGSELHDETAEAHGDTGSGVFDGVDFTSQKNPSHGFQEHEKNEGGNGELNEVRHKAIRGRGLKAQVPGKNPAGFGLARELRAARGPPGV